MGRARRIVPISIQWLRSRRERAILREEMSRLSDRERADIGLPPRQLNLFETAVSMLMQGMTSSHPR